jgi:hypothetical protein
MSATTRINGDYTAFTEGQLYSIYQQKAIAIAVKDGAGNPVSLAAEDSDAQGEVDQAVALIVKEIQPLMYILKGAAHNEIHAIIDGHAIDVDTLEARIQHLGTAVGAGPVDISGSTVVVGTSITVA